MTLKSWKDVARDIQARTAAQPPGAPEPPAPSPRSLLDAAETNPSLRHLLDERERLERRMSAVASGAGFAPPHDDLRFPVEHLPERRARDMRWSLARDEARSAAVQRLLAARRQQSASVQHTPEPNWTAERERRIQEALQAAQAHQSERAAELQALDERNERARRTRREQRDAPERYEALKKALGHQPESTLDLRDLDERIARAREALQRDTPVAERAEQGLDWPLAHERQLADAMKNARLLASRKAAVNQTLDLRLSRARSKSLEPPAPHPPKERDGWQTKHEARRARALERLRARQSEAAGALRPAVESSFALDQRAIDAHERLSKDDQVSRKREHAQDATRRTTPPAFTLERKQSEAKTKSGDDSRLEHVRDKLVQAKRVANKARRTENTALRGLERASGSLRDLDGKLGRLQDVSRDAGVDMDDEDITRARSVLGGVLSLADKAAAPLRRGLARGDGWQEKRDRVLERLRQFKSFDLGNRRKLGVEMGSIDELSALRDKARALWPDDKEKKPAPKEKTLADRAKDLDERRKQALARLTAKRDEDKRQEQSRVRGLARLKSRDVDG